jgi:hypothetical protein
MFRALSKNWMPETGPKISESPFQARIKTGLSRADIESLFTGAVPAILVSGYLNHENCRDILAALSVLRMMSYDPQRVEPPIARFGPALNDYRDAGTLSCNYWSDASAARRSWTRAAFDPDPLVLCMSRLAEAWTGSVRPATIGGRKLFAGTIREINHGARVHFDEIVREYPAGLLDHGIVGQLAFNAFLSTPVKGGETVIWRRRWHPNDERARIGYGYDPTVTEGYDYVEVKACVGDAVLFDPRNYHAVIAAGNDARRITLSFFIGLTDREEVLLWS